MAKNTLLFSAHIYRSNGIIRRVRVLEALHLSGSGPRAYHFLHRALLAVLLPVLPTAETQ